MARIKIIIGIGILVLLSTLSFNLVNANCGGANCNDYLLYCQTNQSDGAFATCNKGTFTVITGTPDVINGKIRFAADELVDFNLKDHNNPKFCEYFVDFDNAASTLYNRLMDDPAFLLDIIYAPNGNWQIPIGTDTGIGKTLNQVYKVHLNISDTANTASGHLFWLNGTWLATGSGAASGQVDKIRFQETGTASNFYIQNLSCWNGTLADRPAVADTTAPVISNINFTSCGGDTTEPYNDNCGDTTPTYTFDTDEAANCKISITNVSNAYDNFNLNCTTTGSTSHVCTLNSTYALSEGNSSVYAACIDGSGNNNTILTANNEFFTILIMDYPTVTLSYPGNNINVSNATTIQFNASARDGSNIKSLTLYGNWTGSWIANATNITAVLNNTIHTITSFSLPIGNYMWNVYACDSFGNCNYSQTNFTFNVRTPVITIVFASNVSELIYNPNWSAAIFINNTANIFWYDSGNYTFTLTDYNITPMNQTSFLFNASNQETYNVDVKLQQNQTLAWSNWVCDNVNITTTATTLFSLASGASRTFNCTLSLINISQTYQNFTLQTDRAYWGFTYTFTS